MIHRYYVAVRLFPRVPMGRPALAFAHRSPLARDAWEVSRFSCRECLGVPGVYDYAGLAQGSRYRPGSYCLPPKLECPSDKLPLRHNSLSDTFDITPCTRVSPLDYGLLCKIAQYAAKHHTASASKFCPTGTYRKLTVSNDLKGQTIRIFGEALAVCPLLGDFKVMFLKNHSHRIRLGEGSEGDMSLLFVISAIWA